RQPDASRGRFWPRVAGLGLSAGGRRLPRPAPLQLDLEGEAQEGPDQDDQPEEGDAFERQGDGHGADDVGGDEELEAEEDGATDPLAEPDVDLGGVAAAHGSGENQDA